MDVKYESYTKLEKEILLTHVSKSMNGFYILMKIAASLHIGCLIATGKICFSTLMRQEKEFQ
jgi:hypothetical protein